MSHLDHLVVITDPSGIKWAYPSDREVGQPVVWIDVKKFDRDWQKMKHFYIGFGGKGQIGRRYPRFGEFFMDEVLTNGLPLIMPEAHIGPNGKIDFVNGRHRYSWLRDHGWEHIPMILVGYERPQDVRKYMSKQKKTKKNPFVPWTKEMRIWARDLKTTCLVLMKPSTFLYLTTSDIYQQMAIEDESHPVEKYGEWVEKYQIGMPLWLRVELDENGKDGKVTGHEGRHRAAAMKKSGESLIPVCIVLRHPTKYDRDLNAGDLPKWWKPETWNIKTRTRKLKHITDIIEDIIVPDVQTTGIKKTDVEKYGYVTPVRENPPRSYKFIRLYSHKYMAYIDYRKHPTRKGYVTRQRFEGDGFHWGPVTGKKIIKDTTATKEIRKLEATGNWKITRANPGEVIRPGPTFFRDQAQMRAIQEEVYQKTGRWVSPDQIHKFLRDAAVKQRRKSIRVVK